MMWNFSSFKAQYYQSLKKERSPAMDIYSLISVY